MRYITFLYSVGLILVDFIQRVEVSQEDKAAIGEQV